jgi:4-hydroxy-3-polyprenylbenzoate decarboxylase
MIFNSVTGHPDARVLVGLMASRERVGILLDSPPRRLTQRMARAYRDALGPVTVGSEQAVCQEVIYRADDPGFDIRTILPAPTNTPRDAGPYFCLGLVLGSDPELGTDVTIHRLCVQGKDEISIFFAPGRHIDHFRKRAEAAGRPFPISVNMGLDPAIHIGASFEAPTTPLGYNELAIAGGLRNTPVGLVDCVSVEQKAIARAEIVIEGHIVANRRVAEDQNTHTGHSMPEFPATTAPPTPRYRSSRSPRSPPGGTPSCRRWSVRARNTPSWPGSPPKPASSPRWRRPCPASSPRSHAHTAGGGKFLAILKCNKTGAFDDGRARQAALIALGVFSELKNIHPHRRRRRRLRTPTTCCGPCRPA